MSDPILADQIRAFAFKTYVEPAAGTEVSIRAGDVHKAMGLAARVPLVVGSLRAKQFGQQYGLELLRKEGAPISTTTTFVFRRIGAAVEAPGASGVAWAEVALSHGSAPSEGGEPTSRHSRKAVDHRCLAALGDEVLGAASSTASFVAERLLFSGRSCPSALETRLSSSFV